MKQIRIAVLLLLVSSTSQAQNHAQIWNWDLGFDLDFNQDSVQYSARRNLHTDMLSSQNESGSSYTDSLGNLLLYTNGEVLFDKHDDTIVDQLFGGTSNLQSSLIIRTKNRSTFVIVTNGNCYNQREKQYGLRYSVVDIGCKPAKVIAKNILLNRLATSESLAAYSHPSKDITWIATREYKDLLIYKLIDNEIKLHQRLRLPLTECNSIGQIKFSNQGNFIGITHGYYDYVYPEQRHVGFGETIVVRFNIETGHASEGVNVFNSPGYGLEFSPNEKYVFVSTQCTYRDSTRLWQISNPYTNPTDTSKKLIYSAISNVLWPLQLNPHGEIYCLTDLSYTSIAYSVIENPNLPICQFNLNMQVCNNLYTSTSGTPNFVQDYIYQPYIRSSTICEGETVAIPVHNLEADSVFYQWENGPLMRLDSSFIEKHFSKAGSYRLKVYIHYPASVKVIDHTQVVKPRPYLNLGNDTLLFVGSSFEFNSSLSPDSFLWSDQHPSLSRSWNSDTTLSLAVWSNGCSSSDEISTYFLYYGFHDSVICLNDSSILKLNESRMDSALLYIDSEPILSYSQDHDVSERDPGRYTIDVKLFYQGLILNFNEEIELVKLNFNPFPDSLFWCEPQSLELTHSDSFNLYFNGNKNLESMSVNSSGWQFVQADYLSCSEEDSVFVLIENCQCDYYIPNAFSPNNDGINDIFDIIHTEECPLIFSMLSIYNRWGQLIYEGSTPWDGLFASPGVYIYQWKGMDRNGSWIHRTGSLHLME